MLIHDHLVLLCSLSYLLVLNGVGFIMMGRDKEKAQKQYWRTPENQFLAIACLGGSLGVWAGMYYYRHKTKHKKFTIGLPVIVVLQLLVLGYVLINLGPHVWVLVYSVFGV